MWMEYSLMQILLAILKLTSLCFVLFFFPVPTIYQRIIIASESLTPAHLAHCPWERSLEFCLPAELGSSPWQVTLEGTVGPGF